MKTWKTLITLTIMFLLAGCGSPFAPVIVASTDVPTLASPTRIPASISGKSIVWYGGVLDVSNITGKETMPFPESAIWPRLSNNGQYMTFLSKPVIVGKSGLPTTGDETLRILDLQTTQVETLVSKAQSFPDAVTFETPTFTPDNKDVIFEVDWKNSADLVKVNITNGHVQRLNVNVLLTNFGHPDVSSRGQIVVICKGPKADNVSELCLLSKDGKFIRYITSERYPWPGYGLFTPDGQYVVYESQYKFYKVRVDGSGRQQIAPCGMLGPTLVTADYAVIQCYISQKPDCYALFVAGLDGKDFRRIGYVKPVCNNQ